MSDPRYDAIFQWNMTTTEAQVFKLCCIWEDQTQKLFPRDNSLARLPSRSDPRDCQLFKFCWKLLRETRGLLKDDEYRLYIIANLAVLKADKRYISPNGLCGNNAWIRWKIWKKLYEAKKAELAGEEPPKTIEINPKVMRQLECTKRLLHEKCEGVPTFECLEEWCKNGSLQNWLMSGKVSPYYVLLSPWVSKLCKIEDLEKTCSFDSKLFIPNINDGVKAYFEKEFAYEL